MEMCRAFETVESSTQLKKHFNPKKHLIYIYFHRHLPCLQRKREMHLRLPNLFLGLGVWHYTRGQKLLVAKSWLSTSSSNILVKKFLCFFRPTSFILYIYIYTFYLFNLSCAYYFVRTYTYIEIKLKLVLLL